MPSLPPRYCVTPGCGTITHTTRCPRHQRTTRRAYRNPTHDKVYASRRWKLLRRRVLNDEPVCQQPGCRSLSIDVDHIVALHDGGPPYARSNVQALCKPHHSAKTALEVRSRAR